MAARKVSADRTTRGRPANNRFIDNIRHEGDMRRDRAAFDVGQCNPRPNLVIFNNAASQGE